MNKSKPMMQILGGLGLIVAGLCLGLLVIIYWLPGELTSIQGLMQHPGNFGAFQEAFGFKFSDLWFLALGIAAALVGSGIVLIRKKDVDT